MSKSFKKLINKMPTERQERIKQKAKMLEACNEPNRAGEFGAAESVPWQDAFPDLTAEQLPGVCLKGARVKEGITQKRLAELTGVKQHHISEMENQKRPISKRNAKIFAGALNVSYELFLKASSPKEYL
jgi:DNA-binding XRE family transcriptional regulator